jgi:hypothetical protein
MARKRPDARDIERVLEETVNVMTAAHSDVARWNAAGRALADDLRLEAAVAVPRHR